MTHTTMTPFRLSLVALASMVLMGFSPFSSGGLAQFDVERGAGAVGSGGDQLGSVETGALFQTLSSRYGGGGVLIYMEHPAGRERHAGLLLIDLRHAGLSDLEEAVVQVPDARRAELYYQEWDDSGDLFRGGEVTGQIYVKELLRGKRDSALAITFELVFKDNGPDGVRDTADDLWRAVSGSATTVPTVEDVLRAEPELFSSRSRGEYAPDGDIQVSCTGEVDVEEERYDENSYAYEDNSSSCSGDTWEDDAEDPDEGSGCAGKETLDDEDQQPDPEAGCDDGVGDDIDDPSADEQGSYYDGDYDEQDSTSDGCADRDSDTGSAEESEDDTSEDSGDESDDDDSSSCAGDEEVEEVSRLGRELKRELAALGVREAHAATSAVRARDRLRRRLDRLEAGHRSAVTARTITRARFGRSTQRTIQRLLNYLPFVLLGFGIRRWRRRLSRT